VIATDPTIDAMTLTVRGIRSQVSARAEPIVMSTERRS
jgi:hypothetical protein